MTNVSTFLLYFRISIIERFLYNGKNLGSLERQWKRTGGKKERERFLQNHLSYSEHALTRIAQRGLSDSAIEYVIQHGQRYRCAGAIHCFLRKCDIPASDQGNDAYAKLEGTLVILSRKGRTVITVYRNRKASRQVRRKNKTDYKLERYGD